MNATQQNMLTQIIQSTPSLQGSELEAALSHTMAEYLTWLDGPVGQGEMDERFSPQTTMMIASAAECVRDRKAGVLTRLLPDMPEEVQRYFGE